jgi:hypothetical protein
MEYENLKFLEPLRKLVGPLRKKLSQNFEIREFQNKEPVPHKFILKENQTEKLSLSLSLENPDQENIKAFEFKIIRSTDQDKEFETYHSIKVGSSIEITNEKQGGKILNIITTAIS